MSDVRSAGPPPHRPVFRILWRVIVVVSVLFTGGSAVKAGLSAIFARCWDDKTDLSSPDGKHIAHRSVHSCEGPTMFDESFHQVVDISQAGTNENARVYETNYYGGKMRWEDSDHLRIDIDSTEAIGLSLHKANDVRIAYHVPARLMSFYWQDVQDRQQEEMHRTGKMSDADYDTAKRVSRYSRSWHGTFIEWASENAVIDNEGK